MNSAMREAKKDESSGNENISQVNTDRIDFKGGHQPHNYEKLYVSL